MTPKQERFVEEYLVDLNATQAAIRAGYSARVANRIASENMSKPVIAQAIQAKRAELSASTGVTIARVVQELARVAFSDSRCLVGSAGEPKGLHELDEDTARAVVGADVVRFGNAEVGVGEVLKVKLADKVRAAELLLRHLGGFEKDNSQSKPQVTITGFRVVAE